MLASCRTRYSGFMGACWARKGLVWSYRGAPPSGTRLHWPDQSGYFASSNAHARCTGSISAAASASEAIEFCNIVLLPYFICGWPADHVIAIGSQRYIILSCGRKAASAAKQLLCRQAAVMPAGGFAAARQGRTPPCRCGRNGAFWRPHKRRLDERLEPATGRTT